jgi:small subunit ribosomal protein S13
LAEKNKKPEEKVEKPTEENKDKKKIEQSPTVTNKATEHTKLEKNDDKKNGITNVKSDGSQEKKPTKINVKKELKKPDKKLESDFNYIVRIANTDIDGEKTITFGLTQIKGLGRRTATFVADTAEISRETKCGNLTDSQLAKINDILENLSQKAPAWMLNHRKDYDTGKDVHLIGSDVEMRLRDDVNLLKMIRSYRGIRHELNLRARGQRTRSNSRKGLALGVSKKRQ